MERSIALSFMTLALTVSAAYAQDGVLSRTGRALDNAVRGIRNAVETEVERGGADANDREVLGRVIRRLEWDKPMAGSTIQVQVQPGGIVYLRGSVRSAIHKQRAAALVESTVGVSSVVDELAVAKEVKVIQARPATRVVEVAAPAPASTTVIVKP
jgi:osmotically-inducible protein OsmY